MVLVTWITGCLFVTFILILAIFLYEAQRDPWGLVLSPSITCPRSEVMFLLLTNHRSIRKLSIPAKGLFKMSEWAPFVFAKNPVLSVGDWIFFERRDLLVMELQRNNALVPQVRWVRQISSSLFHYCWSIVQNVNRQCMAAVVCIRPTECACF